MRQQWLHSSDLNNCKERGAFNWDETTLFLIYSSETLALWGQRFCLYFHIKSTHECTKEMITELLNNRCSCCLYWEPTVCLMGDGISMEIHRIIPSFQHRWVAGDPSHSGCTSFVRPYISKWVVNFRIMSSVLGTLLKIISWEFHSAHSITMQNGSSVLRHALGCKFEHVTAVALLLPN